MKLFQTLSITILVLFPNCILSQLEYSDADCTGVICAFDEAYSTYECIGTVTGYYVDQDGNEPEIESVAVNPVDGQIYVLYTSGGSEVFLGILPNPVTDLQPPAEVNVIIEMTKIGGPFDTDNLAVGGGMTFDCAGNLYVAHRLNSTNAAIIQIEYNGTTASDTVLDITSEIYSEKILIYNYDTTEFYRFSTAQTGSSLLFVRSTITGADMPAGGTQINYNGFCTGPQTQITAAIYIGNNITLIKCINNNNVFMLDTSDISNPTVRDVPNNYALRSATGLVNYMDPQSTSPCVASCPTPNPTTNPTPQTLSPTEQTNSPTEQTKSPSKSPTDSDESDESDDTSNSDSSAQSVDV